MAARKNRGASCPVILAKAADQLSLERKLQLAVKTPARTKGIAALRLAVKLAHLGRCTPARKALAQARRALKKGGR